MQFCILKTVYAHYEKNLQEKFSDCFWVFISVRWYWNDYLSLQFRHICSNTCTARVVDSYFEKINQRYKARASKKTANDQILPTAFLFFFLTSVMKQLHPFIYVFSGCIQNNVRVETELMALKAFLISGPLQKKFAQRQATL